MRGNISARMCVFLHLIPLDRPKAMGWGISAVTAGRSSVCVCVCERVGDRELECGDYFTVAQLGCRVLMYFSRAQLCVEAVVGFRGRKGGGGKF